MLKKGVVGAAAIGLLVSGFSLSAKAFDEPVNGQAEVISKKYGIVQSVEYDTQPDGTITTMADSGNKDGGYWIRGKRDGQVVSEYKHYTNQGRASVTNGAGHHEDGGWKAKDIWSKADRDWTFFGVNKSYYDYRKAE